MPQLIECVPNISEGRDPGIIRAITDEVERVDGVTLLHVDPGKSTNRTVITFAGAPGPVTEAAFRLIERSGELIDMRRHKGEHPRMGATDVCPLVPISGITMEETAQWATDLARRVGTELALPVYLYEYAQPNADRRNLSVIRAGEYEGFTKKITEPGWAPDFGPKEFDLKRGATVIGARDFLVAYNVNLNTTSTRWANAIAFDVREIGRPKREGHPLTGKIVKDAAGNQEMIPGSLKAVKAIGWFIEEYGIAQVSMNLTNLSITPLAVAFDETCRKAEARGVRVTGSELVGLVPLNVMLDAGRYFLKKQRRSAGISEHELIHIAVKSLGLDELAPFKPEERIIEYRLAAATASKRLVDLTVEKFADVTASESAAPGGGSVAALLGALGASLGTMVANLSAHKRGWDERWEEFSRWAEEGQALKAELIGLVDRDTSAFNEVMAALGMPKNTPEETAARKVALQQATINATKVPLQVLRVAHRTFPLLKAMAEHGNPASASDAGVGALAARSAVIGAWLNVRINVVGLKDKTAIQAEVDEASKLVAATALLESEVLEIVEAKIGA